MRHNQVIKTMLDHRSIRRYKSEAPSDHVVKTIVRAGQQAPFASQMYSVLLSRKAMQNPFRAPLLFTICIDSHKFELIMARRGWKMATNDLTLLIFGIEDAMLMAENMVIAARSLGIGSCFLGFAMYKADRIAEEYELPKRVFPLVQLAMGHPAEDPPPRPRYPIEFTLFEDKYPALDDDTVSRAMRQMDEGYLEQDYYRRNRAKIKLERGRKESYSYADYNWTEHICRKWGQWYPRPTELLNQLKLRGFKVT
ncbi:MAG: nitroreductase family protein [Thermoplasmata archaeon]|jgi:FMN reductase (NADPH)